MFFALAACFYAASGGASELSASMTGPGSDVIVMIDTVYYVEVVADRVVHTLPVPMVRGQMAETMSVHPEFVDRARQAETQDVSSRNPARWYTSKWLWTGLGVGTAVLGYTWMSGGASSEPPGTLHITIDGMPQ